MQHVRFPTEPTTVLFHATATANVWGVLSRGLVLPWQVSHYFFTCTDCYRYLIMDLDSDFFSLPLLPKAKRSVGNKESGLEKIVVDMLRPKIKLR